MLWKKLGRIFCASGENSWMIAGGRAPIPLYLGNDIYRIYFGCYDAHGRGRVFSLEIDINRPQEIKKLFKDPVLDIGNVGFFDDNGIIPSDIVRVGSKVFMYTIGFSVKNKLIFDAASGLAISKDGGLSFEKLDGPVLDRGVKDPCFAASPTVLLDKGIWRMWYVSCEFWKKDGTGYQHFYNIKHRTSEDGVYWNQKASTSIDFKGDFEYAISRPSVYKDENNKYHMWYSFRGQRDIKTYRIGYAKSDDGITWIRKDQNAGIDVSDVGWDSEMICYPRVFKHDGSLMMLYNGNQYGRSGWGLACLETGLD